MITNNYESLISQTIVSSSVIYGNNRVVDVNNEVRYLCGSIGFPNSISGSVTLNATSAGISIGTGNTPATKNDINLESTITSGVIVTMVSTTVGNETNGDLFLKYIFSVVNTGSSALTIREIGYKQTLTTTIFPGYKSSTNVVCLLDRTVFDTPIVIQAGDAGVVEYKLKIIKPEPQIKNGIKLVPFEYTTDEEIVAMIDGARNGLIDLQADANWKVGDARKIHIAEFTGGNNVVFPEQDVYIMISQFGSYKETVSMPCLFQFDFTYAGYFRMNSTGTTSGGYGASEMYTTTIPALVEALPTWLKDRLLTFTCLTRQQGGGSGSYPIIEVENNKLALRSTREMNLGGEAEGSSVDLFKIDTSKRNYNSNFWFRSPYTGDYRCYCYFNGNDVQWLGASGSYNIKPFGLL